MIEKVAADVFPRVFIGVVTVCGGLAGVPAANAAVVAGNVNVSAGTSVNLTAIGTTNWALWDGTSSSNVATLAPTATLAGGPATGEAGYVSGIGRVGNSSNTDVRGGANASQALFSYSNGTSPATRAASISDLVIASTTALNVTGQGVTLSVTGDPGQLYRVSVWASGLDGVGTMTASLAGADDVILTATYGNASADGSKPVTLFTFDFQPDQISDVLNLSYVLTAESGANNSSHVGISAVAVAVIPEPSTSMALLAGLGVLGLLRRRV